MYLYLHGFASGPTSAKAQLFQERFARFGHVLTVPALDEGDFEHFTITRQLRLIERFAVGPRPHVIIGSSLGGYLAALHASTHPTDALILMAPAIDFARRLEARDPAGVCAWEAEGTTLVDHWMTGRKERLSFDLLRDARQHAPAPVVAAPMLVLQGLKDDVVPAAVVARWVERQPQARLITYETGHELTDVVASILDETEGFLRRMALI